MNTNTRPNFHQNTPARTTLCAYTCLAFLVNRIIDAGTLPDPSYEDVLLLSVIPSHLSSGHI